MLKLIADGAEKLGVPISGRQAEQLAIYGKILKEWNEKINLTAITDDEGIAAKHFLDSLSAFKTGHVGKKVIDIGTGAGFPGLVLKIAAPDMELTLLDSLNKRITFLKELAAELKIDGVEFIHGRAEDFAVKCEYREKYDTVLSRAVANMTTLSEWCLPYVKKGGYFLALKGPLADKELTDAKCAIHILGGSVEGVTEVNIPFAELNHRIINVKKVRQTPMRFPRKPAIAAKMSVEQCYKMRK